MIRSFFTAVLVLTAFYSNAQIDYTNQYANAKDLFRQGKYNLAMEAFKPLIAYDQNNRYSEYASYYYALSAYKQGFRAVAKDMITQIRTLYPKWDQMNEVNFLLARIYFENKDYFQGLKVLNSIEDKKFEADIRATKTAYVSQVTDLETLRMMHEEYPKDEIIGKALAQALSKNLADENDREDLEKIIGEFKLKRDEYIPEAPKTFHKDEYSVSLLMPFMVNTLEPSPGKKRNQIVLDFYEGMKLALDTLNKQGPRVNLYVYDTERNSDKLKKLLQAEELINTDLIVGPFFPEENEPVQQFSFEHRINVVNPFSNSTDIIGNNPHAYLFQPSSETLGTKAAEYVAARTTRKDGMVFYGTSKKDSTMAANYIRRATELGINIVSSLKFNNRETRQILEILATPTEFDEFKYPTQFTLAKDSIGSIYVATDEALIYSEVVSAVETRADSIKVIGSENWISDNAIDPEKYQTLGIALAAPNFADPADTNYKSFYKRFIRRYGRTPSPVSRMGYELMLFFGNQLKTNGVFFQDGLAKAGTLPGYLTEGFHYGDSRNNSLVPFITFKKGQLTLVEKR